MNNYPKGSAAILLIIIGVLVLGGGIYLLNQKRVTPSAPAMDTAVENNIDTNTTGTRDNKIDCAVGYSWDEQKQLCVRATTPAKSQMNSIQSVTTKTPESSAQHSQTFIPSGFKTYVNNSLSISYPPTWQLIESQNDSEVLNLNMKSPKVGNYYGAIMLWYHKIGPIPLNTNVALETKSLEDAGHEITESVPSVLSGEPAYKITYSWITSNGEIYKGTEYVTGNTSVVFIGKSSVYNTYYPVAIQIINSLKIN